MTFIPGQSSRIRFKKKLWIEIVILFYYMRWICNITCVIFMSFFIFFGLIKYILKCIVTFNLQTTIILIFLYQMLTLKRAKWNIYIWPIIILNYDLCISWTNSQSTCFQNEGTIKFKKECIIFWFSISVNIWIFSWLLPYQISSFLLI